MKFTQADTTPAPAAKFENVGDTITGTVLNVETHYEVRYGATHSDGTAKRYTDDANDPDIVKSKKGRPRPQWIIKVATDQRDATIEDDEGHRTIWAKWSQVYPIQDAGFAIGIDDTDDMPGCLLTLTVIGLKDYGLGNPGKVYTAKLERQAPDLDAF